jgi:glycosyltransferase involved in cell wall biosynthesis
LYKKLKEEDRKNIKFFDFLSQKQQEPLIAITDLSVMPSTYENQPMAMIETVLRGIPIIASKYSGCADYLDENMLFDPFDEKDLLNKIQNFYNLSKADQDCVAARQKEKLLEVLKPENCILPRFYLKFKPSKSTELNMEDLYHE